MSEPNIEQAERPEQPQSPQTPDEQPTYTDQVNEEMPAKPDGAPELVPLLQLQRRRRAHVIRRLSELRKHQNELPQSALAELAEDEEAEGGQERTPEQEQEMFAYTASMFDLLADAEELLTEVAKDREAFTEWVAQADDQALMALAGYYLRTLQPGEALASPGS